MKINIFEGARRISLLIGGAWSIGFIGYAIFSSPYVVIDYKIFLPGERAIQVDGCSSEDATEYIYVNTPSGDSIRVNLCFSAQRADNGQMLIPYAPTKDGRLWMNEKYSTAVSDYTKRVADTFQLDEEGIKAANKKMSAGRREQWKDSMQYLFGGLIVGWIFISAIGWIVRGFMGIPQGMDKRPDDVD